MREIKFRVWDKKYRQMHFGGDIRIALVCPADDLEIMQFTGLKDKNGKEIYEGDVVIGNCLPRPAYIDWLNDRASFGWVIPKTAIGEPGGAFGLMEDALEDNFNLEIIGNIYENPELLKKE